MLQDRAGSRAARRARPAQARGDVSPGRAGGAAQQREHPGHKKTRLGAGKPGPAHGGAGWADLRGRSKRRDPSWFPHFPVRAAWPGVCAPRACGGEGSQGRSGAPRMGGGVYFGVPPAGVPDHIPSRPRWPRHGHLCDYTIAIPGAMSRAAGGCRSRGARDGWLAVGKPKSTGIQKGCAAGHGKIRVARCVQQTQAAWIFPLPQRIAAPGRAARDRGQADQGAARPAGRTRRPRPAAAPGCCPGRRRAGSGGWGWPVA